MNSFSAGCSSRPGSTTPCPDVVRTELQRETGRCPDRSRTSPDGRIEHPSAMPLFRADGIVGDLRWAAIAAPPEALLNAVDDLSRFLKRLHAQAGAPSRREMAQQTGYGKSTIGDAFAGHRLPTWPVVQALVATTGSRSRSGNAAAADKYDASLVEPPARGRTSARTATTGPPRPAPPAGKSAPATAGRTAHGPAEPAAPG
ncbi:helix-turn-helix domain-containing protein [Streptomyces mirabilis]|uniref:helix-turn-helix domain-containing protein n=1 Tax=Streptomyces mirabilis TaxID=68239 RepID=UPI0036578B17